jgi:hypothetical protein
MPKVALLSSVTGDVEHQKLLLAPEECSDPEAEINRILLNLAAEAPHFSWQQASETLRGAGFTPLEDIVEISRAWDESRCSSAMTFAVVFPSDAGHEHAGKSLKASTWHASEGGTITLVDEYGQCLMADDRLWKEGAEGREQVPLGVIHVPSEQFASAIQRAAAVRLLTESGFSVTVSSHDSYRSAPESVTR